MLTPRSHQSLALRQRRRVAENLPNTRCASLPSFPVPCNIRHLELFFYTGRQLARGCQVPLPCRSCGAVEQVPIVQPDRTVAS